jgi:ferrous iron transport protein B
METEKRKTVALAGNPNSGKTTLFNELTGARQHVGNYPGVTVEKKQGIYSIDGKKMDIIDLPGTYSLTAYSIEEIVARDFIINEKPDVVINIVDASNLERNLYLTMQFLELGVNVCIALNMIDIAEKRGIKIDAQKLSELLKVPVIPIIAKKGEGKEELMRAAFNLAEKKQDNRLFDISYGDDIDRSLDIMENEIKKSGILENKYPARWIALKLLEQDEQIQILLKNKNDELFIKLEKVIVNITKHLENTLDSYPEALIADHRFGYIKSIFIQKVIHFVKSQDRLFVSDKIDKVVTNRFAGPLIMLAVVMGLYHFTFTYSEIPVGWFESFFGFLGNTADKILPDGLLKSLVISGIIDGIGGVLGFVPLIVFMFIGISILEDSGYLVRMAFMLDRVFRMFGLHGSSVIPFIISGGIAGGCAIPGIMAARTLKSRRERLATLLTVPFMNCGAKLPVFALLIAAFFPKNKAMMMFIITMISWIGALLIAKILRMTVIKGESTPFVMELPPYHVPTFKGIFIHTWEKTWGYIKKAGTVILTVSVILWVMMTFPLLSDSKIEKFKKEKALITANAPSFEAMPQEIKNKLEKIDYEQAEAALKNSIAGRVGGFLESASRFSGFDWRVNIALIGGFAAKEVIISTLGTAYSLGETDPEASESLAKTLASEPNWNPLVAFSLIIFTMFYAPCFVAVVCIIKESGSYKWGLFSMIFNTGVAFTLSVLVYQIGKIFLI